MAAVRSFPFYKAMLTLRQSDGVNINHWVLNVASLLRWGSWAPCSVVPGEKSERGSPGLSSGARLVPTGAQLNKTERWSHLVSSWSPSRSGVLSPMPWCARRLLMCIFSFQVSSLFILFNTLEFSTWEIVFYFSRQNCCYLSRLSDLAGAYNKC